MPFKDVVDIVESLAVIIAAAAAIAGIGTWRQEHTGKRRLDLAEEVLAMFYEIRTLSNAIRSRYVFTGEGASRTPDDEEAPDVKRKRDVAHVPIERLERHGPKFAKLSSTRFRFMAVFGADKVKLFEKFDHYITNLASAASDLDDLLTIDRFGLKPDDYEPGEYDGMLIKARQEFYGSHDRTDRLNVELDSLIAEVEAVCRKETS